MNSATVFEYHHLFSGPPPDAKLLLKDIPSQMVILVFSAINNALVIKDDNPATQVFILNTFEPYFDDLTKKHFADNVIPKFLQGYELFALPYTVEFIQREILNFRDISQENVPFDLMLRLLKAYVVVMDELIKEDYQRFDIEIQHAANRGGIYLHRLMWPHFLKQFEFSIRPEPVFERFKGRALATFFESDSQFAPYARKYFASLGFNSGQEYMYILEALIVANLQKVRDGGKLLDYSFTVGGDKDEPIFNLMAIRPEDIQNDLAKQFDYRGLKEKPIFKTWDHVYLVLHWYYVFNALFSSFIFAFYNNSGVSSKIKSLGDFKSEIGKRFSEEILFRGIMTSCFSRSNDTLLFFEDNDLFNPDAYYRHANHIFIIEFKDLLLSSDTIQSGSYDRITAELDKKFIEKKGIPQIKRNIETLLKTDTSFHRIDEKAADMKLKIEDCTIHPIIVQTNPYFDFPGFNDYLGAICQRELLPLSGKVKSIDIFVMINIQYFFERLMLFMDSKLELHTEIESYRAHIRAKIVKADMSVQNNEESEVDDWFETMIPFSKFQSGQFYSQFDYRRDDLSNELRKSIS